MNTELKWYEGLMLRFGSLVMALLLLDGMGRLWGDLVLYCEGKDIAVFLLPGPLRGLIPADALKDDGPPLIMIASIGVFYALAVGCTLLHRTSGKALIGFLFCHIFMLVLAFEWHEAMRVGPLVHFVASVDSDRLAHTFYLFIALFVVAEGVAAAQRYRAKRSADRPA